VNVATRPVLLSTRARTSAEDEEIALVRAAQRDPKQFAALYELYFRRISGYVRLRIGDRATCEDVTSQIFARALDKLSSYRGHGPFSAWIFRIARNAIHDEQRRCRGIVALAPDVLDARLGPQAAPEEQALASERRALVRTAIAGLSHDQQHLLALRYGAGLSHEEIASLLGKRAGTVRVRIHRIVNDLRRSCPDEH
jgi:RNA polymerase sigma-70 factor (ECF subfamily)